MIPGGGPAVAAEPGINGWDRTGRVAADIRQLVDDRLRRLPQRAAGIVDRLLRAGHHRVVAEYLRALADADRPVVAACERIAARPGAGALRYELGRVRYAAPAAAQARDSAAEVLDATDGGISYHVADPALCDVIATMVRQLGDGLGAFVESQDEVPGPNARIRQGVVKAWFLPDGTRVVSKRENPRKRDRFRREQRAQQQVVERLGAGTAGRRRVLRVPPLLALLRDGATGHVYAVSRWVPGTSLEALLMADPDGPVRAAVLRDYRDLLDALLDRGILWGDLSPRNVLLDRDMLHIVDFEKTTVTDAPIGPAERVRHSRGQIGVEELGVLCTQAEVREVLRGYFDPDGWDLESTAPVQFPLRPEVADVLCGRGVTAPTLGHYNRTDLEIFDVRSPDVDPRTGERRYPGLVNFRVEHYLGCAGCTAAGDYDRMTTEILVAARRHGCFEAALAIVTEAADAVERRFVVNEFAHVLDGRAPHEPVEAPATEIRTLIARLEALDAARGHPERFAATCAALEPA